MIEFRHAKDMKLHISSARPIRSRQEGFSGHGLVRLVVEALELVAFFKDAIIFIQDDILISTEYHHPDDIVIRYWELNFLRGTIQNME